MAANSSSSDSVDKYKENPDLVREGERIQVDENTSVTKEDGEIFISSITINEPDDDEKQFRERVNRSS